jgi:hypothetical protein
MAVHGIRSDDWQRSYIRNDTSRSGQALAARLQVNVHPPSCRRLIVDGISPTYILRQLY